MTSSLPDRYDRLIDMLVWRMEVEGLLPAKYEWLKWSDAEEYKDRLKALLREVLVMKAPEL